MTRIAAIGSSGHSCALLEELPRLDNADLVAYAPGHEGEEMWAPGRSGAETRDTRRFEDWRAMLDEVEPDVLIVDTRFDLHAEVALAGAEHGCHLLVEKPLALDLDQLAALERAVGAAKVQCIAMFDARFRPEMVAARAAVAQGRIGEPLLVSAQKSYRLGRRPRFYSARETFGGTMVWVTIHAIDFVRHVAGLDYTWVSASHTKRGNRDHGELEAVTACLLQFENGGSAVIHTDYLRPDGAPSHGDDRLRLAGTDGVLEVSGGRASLLGAAGEETLEGVRVTAPLSDFLDCIQRDGAGRVTTADSFYVTRVALEARRAADTGETVALNTSVSRKDGGAS